MKAIVVFESHWGNTAAVAKAIAEGLGPGAQALSTTEAKGPTIEKADFVVAGSPVIDAASTQEAPETDHDGNPRPHGPAADIGAYEYTPAPPDPNAG